MSLAPTYPDGDITCRAALAEPGSCPAVEGGGAPWHSCSLVPCCSIPARTHASAGKEEAAHNSRAAEDIRTAGIPIGTGSGSCLAAVGRHPETQTVCHLVC